MSEPRPVLGPAGNKARSVVELRKPVSKPTKKVEKPHEVSGGDIGVKGKKAPSAVTPNTLLRSNSISMPSILRQRDQKSFNSNLSLNASCSSDASSDSSLSRVSSGKISRRVGTPTAATIWRTQCGLRSGRVENVATESDCSSEASADAAFV